MQPSSVTIFLATCRCSADESKQLVSSSRLIASSSSISLISILFSNDVILPMEGFRLVIRILPLLPRGMNLATTSGGGSSALSNTINHSPSIQEIHWMVDSTEPSIPEPCAAGMLDMPCRDIVMLSREEASTQNTCEKLEQGINSY